DSLNYRPLKLYTITHRPVYRPGHVARYRMWLRQPRFSGEETQFADQDFLLEVRNPRGDIVEERAVHSDRWGGIDGEWSIPEDSVPGNYQLRLTEPAVTDPNRRGAFGVSSFAVEEYRKPEFKVSIETPERPVQLGEQVEAIVRAEYYFGAPVAEGHVHYKVERTKKSSRWYPVATWDWLYSPGYWWFAPDYDWYPGWSRWGCLPPIPPWADWSPDPPELVLEGDAELNPDGTVVIPIETLSALQNHSDSDHSYSITAEVVDQSRRTITEKGSVLVARDPFKVFVWTDRGHYRTGDTVNVGVRARTPDGLGVAGAGRAVLHSVTWQDGQPIEREVSSFDVTTDESGQASLKLVIPSAGQYRISVNIRDGQGHEQEGGYILFVRGPGDDGRGYQFNDLELIADKREYQPGDTVRLQINTNKPDGTVLLFVRPMNGLCPKPKVIRLTGKSTEVEIPVGRDDMPNVFVEAMTIADGRVHSALREIVVPPEQHVANVEVLPSAAKMRPREEAVVRVRLTDLDGQPFVGNTVLSVYDASLEAIAASRIPEIRSFFWNVRRHHHVSFDSTLRQYSFSMNRDGEPVMVPFFASDGGTAKVADTMMMARGAMMMPEAAAPMAMAAADGAMEGAGAQSVVEPTVRSNFADTAFWSANVTADTNGIAEIRFPVPDNLTTWLIKAWVMGDGTRVGQGSCELICSKDLIIRPQTPRFVTETDTLTLSAVVHNYLETAKDCVVVLETEGGCLKTLSPASQNVRITAGGEARVDWIVEAVASGSALIRMKALTDEESDAAQYSIPVQVHGILKTDSFTGVIRPDQQNSTVEIHVPAARIEEQSRLEIHYSPSLAGAMVDSLPYLIDYPYGCTEQTLNRFLPAVITQQTLKRMGIDLAAVRDQRTNLNAQELGDPAERAAQRNRNRINPVFDDAEMQKIVRQGVTDLTNMQLSDGGWGWFSGYGEHSSPHLTALIVHGLTIAEQNDVPVLPDVIERGRTWLQRYEQDQVALLEEGDRVRKRQEADRRPARRQPPYRMQADNLDAFISFVLAESDQGDVRMVADYLYRDRGHLSAYGMSLLGLRLHGLGDVQRRDMVLRNIEQFLEQDDENQTAWLRMGENSWWYWYGSENEAMARYLQLLLKIDPRAERASRLVKYLLNNRSHGSRWNSTRDTAVVVEALADYLKATGEMEPNMTVEVIVDGTVQKQVRITADNFFSFDNSLVLTGDAVATGRHTIELRRTGAGPVYFNAWLTNFTKEDHISEAGLEVRIQRKMYRLERDDASGTVRGNRGQVVQQDQIRYRRIPLNDADRVQSGDLIEVELLLDSRNDYEYLLIEDHKPAGFEPDDQLSGYVFSGLPAYRELRDNRVCFFVSRLARGNHSLTYRMRAETPSRQVSALPAVVNGMYAPELAGNSDDVTLGVDDR
ncbi:MAG: alpha-2-macroglobulin, partial [Planctomycetaceae bacterium]|nr:alpha-2-macroglobulin [Planctomycetaceae bacterium]